jgi:GT2 family glycosyltransferase/SAM-dependent methyltransferase
MTPISLTSLFYANRGNISDKWEQYLAIYDAELRPWQQRGVSLLEIGVQNGGSMQVWAKYFGPDSNLIGLDIDERILQLDHPENVELLVVDATDSAQLSAALGDRTFDIILDDGSHFSSDISNSFRHLFSRLAPGGKYIIEDLHCSYWAEFGGGLRAQGSAIEFIKNLVDLVNFHHLEPGADLGDRLGDELQHQLRTRLARVTFYDSVAVIERLASEKMAPYRRVLAGDTGHLVSPTELMAVEEPGQLYFVEPLARRIESGVVASMQELRRLRQQAASLRHELELATESLERERVNSAAIDDDRRRLDVHLSTLRRHPSRDEAMRSLAATLLACEREAVSAQNGKTIEADRLTAELSWAREQLATLSATLAESSERAASFGEAVNSLRSQVSAIERSASYRAMEPVRRAARLVRKHTRPQSSAPLEYVGAPGRLSSKRSVNQAAKVAYPAWRAEYGTLTFVDRQLIDEHVASDALPPIVVLVRTNRSDTAHLDEVCQSLLLQRHSNWQAWLLFDGHDHSPVGLAFDDLVLGWVAKDSRFRVANECEEIPLDAAAVTLTDTSTALSEHALYLFAEAVGRGQVVYGDAEFANAIDSTITPVFKPRFSPLHQELHSYIGETITVHNDASTRTELLLRFCRFEISVRDVIAAIVAESAAIPLAVEHVPFVVQREYKHVADSGARDLPSPTTETVRVSIIIPTRDRLELLEPCIESVLHETAYDSSQIEILVVDNGSTDPATLDYLRRKVRSGEVTVVRDDGDFNFSRLNNRAAEVASGQVLVLLNNDTTVLDPHWLSSLVSRAMNPGVGAVGAKLLYPDGSVQHGGVALGIQGVAAHVNHMLPVDDWAYDPVADLTHEVAAVTGACLAIRREVYWKVGGLDESLAVAFNDIDLCCATLAHGYRNIYVGRPLMIHHESKSRGLDIKPEQQAAFRREALRARSKHPDLYRNDPYYNPNLSLNRSYDLAEPSRSPRPWILARRRLQPTRCILMLSSTHQVGHGVAVIVAIQAKHLASLGHRVILGGPSSDNDFAYAGCERIVLDSPLDAAKYAVECGADVVMMHTPPFYGAAQYLGTEQIKIAYDYGEPDPEFFSDAEQRHSMLADKRFALALADQRLAISESVRNESSFDDMGVLPLGNAHLAVWGPDKVDMREAVRARHGWSDKIVVLNVCRFHAAERMYKGVDAYAVVLNVARVLAPELAARLVFVLCGKGDQSDAQRMGALGLAVFANVSDAEMTELYAAADAYMNLSKWEGYNLGVGQALAMGLPTLASDIPAHRAFGIITTNDVAEQVAFLESIIPGQPSSPSGRAGRVFPWDAPLAKLAALVAER